MEIVPIDTDKLDGPSPKATWEIPGSKSITNRALILCALTKGNVKLEGNF